MAEDYQVTSLKTYSAATGNEEASNDAGPFLLGGAATDDGEWNVGDPSADRFPGTTFEGSYEADGTTFLVFDAGTTIIIYSVGGTTASSGYPANLGDLPTLTTTLPVCFAAGTRIATPAGGRAVETLAIGDLVTTADGRAVPVRWVGRQTVHTLFAGERARPVRVAAGALGNGLPHADLVLTVDHALILDGLAINAGALVNDTTITLEPLAALPRRATYYHVEIWEHDVVLANGAPAETYVDYIQRAAFDNHAEYLALYGDDRTIHEMDRPRVSAARLVPPAIRARLAGKTAA